MKPDTRHPDMPEREVLTDEDLAQEAATDLPDREAMSIIDPMLVPGSPVPIAMADTTALPDQPIQPGPPESS